MDDHVLILTPKQIKKLDEVLTCAQDEGPVGDGWKSDELMVIAATVGASAKSNPRRGPTIIQDNDVYWEMTWDQERFKDKPPTEMIFEDAPALARLLAEGVIFINSFWWKQTWGESAKKMTSLSVNCNDIFAWGCADAEELQYEEIQSLYDAWYKDRLWGAAKWCCVKRGQRPQPPVEKAMREAGAWDDTMEALPLNTQDAEIRHMLDVKQLEVRVECDACPTSIGCLTK